jgi:hypothetical protein
MNLRMDALFHDHGIVLAIFACTREYSPEFPCFQRTILGARRINTYKRT